ncbi:MAG TPA: ABC transporter permease [Polyangiaceae bacterium]|nr:ABC transporter permease [Polyangiaceae bacterium]HMR74322.1 ABC transporter permease [Polyangiaceae bacterium]
MTTLLRRPWFGPLVALVLVYALFAAVSPDTFARAVNLSTMARQTVVVAIAAVGMTYVIIHGGIDLSVGSVVAVTTVVVAQCLRAGYGPLAASGIGVLAALLAGLVNGVLVAHLRITPFIVTLGTMSVLRGAAKGLANEQKIDADPRGLDELMAAVPPDSWQLLPTGVWIALATAVVAAVVLRSTVFGRHVVAIGSNEQTALLCGVPVPRVTILVYVLAGALAGLAGVMEFSTLTVGDPTDSIGLELEVIAAVVIGGGSLAGGQGSIWGAMVGALLMTVIKTGCTHAGVPNWVQEILTGAIIVIAVAIDRFRRR